MVWRMVLRMGIIEMFVSCDWRSWGVGWRVQDLMGKAVLFQGRGSTCEVITRSSRSKLDSPDFLANLSLPCHQKDVTEMPNPGAVLERHKEEYY